MGRRQGIASGRRARIAALAALLATSVLAVAACGSSAGGDGADPKAVPHASVASDVIFTQQATAGCVRARGAVRLPKRVPFGEGRNIYLRQALPLAMRMQAGLRRLHPPGGKRGSLVKQLLLGYGNLVDAYQHAAASPTEAGASSGALRRMERSVQADAVHAGLPECSPPSV